jgi:hypothetical protein
LPDTLKGALGRVQTRWRIRAVLYAIAAGGAVFGAAIVFTTVAIASLAAAVTAAVLVLRQRRLSLVAAALVVERANGAFDNLLVTAAEVEERPRPLAAEIRDEIARQAGARLSAVDPSQAVPLGQAVAVSIAVLAGCGLLIITSSRSPGTLSDRLRTSIQGGLSDVTSITVTVTPPAYTRKPIETLDNPVQVSVIQGSRVRIESESVVLQDQVANESASLVLRAGETAPPRFLSLVVVPDAPPSVRFSAPG